MTRAARSILGVGYKGGPSKLRMRALRAVGADDARHPSGDLDAATVATLRS